MQNIKVKIAVKLKKTPHMWKLARRFGYSSNGVFVSEDTDLCIEGFESSANSYTVNVIRQVGPDLAIAHHCHTAASVKIAVEHGVPTVILFRNPEDAIPSVVSRFRPGTYEAVASYVSFYEAALAFVDNVILVSFDEATSRTEKMISKIQNLTDIEFDGYESMCAVDKAVKQHIKEWKARSEDPSTTPLPTAEREEKKHRVRDKMHRLPEYNQAANMYQQVCAAYEMQQQRIYGNA